MSKKINITKKAADFNDPNVIAKEIVRIAKQVFEDDVKIWLKGGLMHFDHKTPLQILDKGTLAELKKLYNWLVYVESFERGKL